MSHEKFQACIEACVECAQECERCADACLSESNVAKMADCIKTDRDCAAICWTAASLMSRGSQFADSVCKLCAEICDACADECEKHEHDHCQKCAQACRNCADQCRQMAGVAA
ncbi:MAG: four-helix bundle copper-binding protein [Rubinisphaera brasiliensis]|uniref:four-helix bundle copper-binding protein n=1 Tax=Rubinisphaera brasiliensis TaxID=119 RepID=UPI00391A34C7